MPGTMGGEHPREKLLRKGEDLLAGRGQLSDLSLRKLAEHLGTSHRMLLHHFGSRDGFLAALLGELHQREQEALRAATAEGTYQDALTLMERLYLDPANQPRIAAYFYVLGLAVQDPAPFREFLDSLEDWVTLFTTLGVRDGLTHDDARSRAHALVWTARGLAAQAITSGERQAAFDEFQRVVRYLSGVPGDDARPR